MLFSCSMNGGHNISYQECRETIQHYAGRETIGIDRAQIELNWRQRGFSCALWVDPPGQVWEDYVHQTDELVMLVEGALELEFEGRRRRPAIGEEVLIPALVRHTVYNVGKTTAQWLYGYQQSPPERATQQPMEIR